MNAQSVSSIVVQSKKLLKLITNGELNKLLKMPTELKGLININVNEKEHVLIREILNDGLENYQSWQWNTRRIRETKETKKDCDKLKIY